MITPLSVRDILSRAMSTWFDHFVGFFVLALILTLPLVPLELAPLFAEAGGGGALASIGGLLRSIAGYLLTGVVVFTVFQSLKGESGSVVESLGTVKSRIFHIFAAAILVSIAVGIGLLLCIIPGIYLALMLAVVIPVIVVEEAGIFEAFGRSKELTEGHKIQIFAVYFVYFVLLIIVLIVTSVFIYLVFGFTVGEDLGRLIAEGELTAGAIILAALVDHTTDALIMPLQATLTTVIYYDLRQRMEDVSIDDMFPDLDGGVGGGDSENAVW